MRRAPDAFEINFDGLPGPTHHYAGLAFGNIASENNAKSISNPREAALQSLAKMRLMLQLGVKQGIFLPHPRPLYDVLESYGLPGDRQAQLEALMKQDMVRFCALFSSSFMWAANAATVTSSADAVDERVHITPANLMTQYHRSLEVPYTCAQLKRIFREPYFKVHDPLPSEAALCDEGAANHFRLSSRHGRLGVNVFVYGKNGPRRPFAPKKYPARQSMQASASIAQAHGIGNYVLFYQQEPDAIDAGVFHNDVATLSNENCILFHEGAFLEKDISYTLAAHCDFILHAFCIKAKEMSLEKAVETYFFNSQLVTVKPGQMAVVMPIECQNDPVVDRVLKRIDSQFSPIRAWHYVDCRQSMLNGGGPACLRLRVLATEKELAGINPRFLLTAQKIDALETCVKTYYRDQLTVKDFLDPLFREDCARALKALEDVLDT